MEDKNSGFGSLIQGVAMSIQPIWILEVGVFGQNSERLRTAVERQGLECYVVGQHTLTNNLELLRADGPLTEEDCVVCYSSFPMAHFIQEQRAWTPGSWCAFDNLACSTYYAYWGRYLLNARYTMLPGVEAIRQQDFLYEVFGQSGEVSVRPNTVEKLFVGRCVGQEEFASAIAPARYRPAEMVVVAAKQPILREWRLVVAESRIVAAGQYYANGELSVVPVCPDEVGAFAAEMLREVGWRPDPIFMLDICESQGRLWLLELNSFGCSGLYGCDLDAVVEAASDLARKQKQMQCEH
jgi:hypothetical protein